MKFALIGEKLAHSYSPAIHKRYGYSYELVELKRSELDFFVQNNPYAGFNVTIPYKTEIIPYLHKADELSMEVGAVNTVVKKDGKLYGYNTDVFGMTTALLTAKISVADKKVLILGSGGTALTAKTVCKKEKAAKVIVVSRNGEDNYQNIHRHFDAQVIINTTPVGMYPHTLQSLVSLEKFVSLEGVFDAIYNPLKTELILQAEKQKIPFAGGLSMLTAQAQAARDIFLGYTGGNDSELIAKELVSEVRNIVLVGMPGSGKTAVGKILAEKTNKSFVDTDAEIEHRENMSIPEIFEKKGEEYFREKERTVIADFGKESRQIIATGGGAVLNDVNRKALRQNGVVVRLLRPIELLSLHGRPLSSSVERLKELESERDVFYLEVSDFTVENKENIESTVQCILELL